MSYPFDFSSYPDKQKLVEHFKGKSIDALPTPSFIVNESKFTENCNRMLQSCKQLGAEFRAHVKTHKTLEGSRLQIGGGSASLKTDKVVVSTLAEAWGLMPLVEQNEINDVLFSLPVVESRLPELAAFSNKVPHLRLMLDSVDQLDVLARFRENNPDTNKWSVFIKINMGTDRAGLVNGSSLLDNTLKSALSHEISAHVGIYGFYCHAGHSYKSDSVDNAKSFLLEEVKHANRAAKAAIALDASLAHRLQLSVGATPTAHSSRLFQSLQELETDIGEELSGTLELHAGNYPCCDLQQIATGCVSAENVSVSLLAEVVSLYPKRGDKGPGEQLINAGVIALARESGPLPGFGRVIRPPGFENWIVGRLSQEHGILVPLEEKKGTQFIPLGTKIEIIPQHSCITAAAHPWFYVVDNNIVVDIWVPFRGW